jgi:hypothetical protein
MKPSAFEMAGCHGCGNEEPEWSEFKNHLWCNCCQVDYIPTHNGIFDGPVPIGVCELLGISFDRFNLETQQVESFEIPDG